MLWAGTLNSSLTPVYMTLENFLFSPSVKTSGAFFWFVFVFGGAFSFGCIERYVRS